jgi:hypothetical protein
MLLLDGLSMLTVKGGLHREEEEDK